MQLATVFQCLPNVILLTIVLVPAHDVEPLGQYPAAFLDIVHRVPPSRHS